MDLLLTKWMRRLLLTCSPGRRWSSFDTTTQAFRYLQRASSHSKISNVPLRPQASIEVIISVPLFDLLLDWFWAVVIQVLLLRELQHVHEGLHSCICGRPPDYWTADRTGQSEGINFSSFYSDQFGTLGSLSWNQDWPQGPPLFSVSWGVHVESFGAGRYVWPYASH